MDEFKDGLARNLFSAWTASQLGISLMYARKKYVADDEPMGPFWLALADVVIKKQNQFTDELLGELTGKQTGAEK